MPNPLYIPRLLLLPKGFHPPAIANLKFWFDAGSISGADGDSVASWTDQSGNGNHATQGTAGNRPILKKNQLNGRPAVAFNIAGGTQSLTLPNVMGSPTGAEFIIVAKAFADPAGSANDVGMVNLSGNVGDPAWPFTNGNIYETFGEGTGSVHGNKSKPLNLASAARLYNVSAEANHYSGRLNGDFIFDDSVHVMGFGGGVRSLGDAIAAGAQWRGYMFEILVYNKRLTTSERQSLHTYLTNRYAIAGVASVSNTVTPASFAGLAMWFKADSLALADGDPVSTWTDQSGNGRDITNTLLLRPTFKTAGLNGKNSVRFTTTQSLNLAADFSVASSTSFTVLAVTAPTGDCSVVGHTSGNPQVRLRRGGVNQLSLFFGSAESISSTFARPIGDAALNTFRRLTTASDKFMQDGDTEAFGTEGSDAGALTFRSIGGGIASINFQGDISEFCLYNTSFISNLNIWNLYETYFRDRWALP